jgi:hypothetical protein
LACPFFMPTRKLPGNVWLHPARLPLGGGWSGQCCAPGHEGAEPSDDDLRELCNMGYAAACSRLPQQRSCDAVRFAVAQDRGSRLLLSFVCETGHRPAEHGSLEYDASLRQWMSSHSDPRIQKMAECYVESYLLRRIPSVPADSPLSQNA